MKKHSSIAAHILLWLAAPTMALAGTFTVTNTADSGAGSLRQAILDSNANPPPSGTTNLIQFNIAGAGVQTISLASSLDDITQPVTIDGYTQSGARANTLATGDNAVIRIKIDGGMDQFERPVMRLCDSSTCGIVSASDGSTIRGLCIVQPSSGATTMLVVGSSNDVVSGNFLGVDTDGVTLGGFQQPIEVLLGVTGATIGGTSPAARNVIASDVGFALILADGSNMLVQGNYLGVNAAGTALLGSLASGIDIEQGTGNSIGGAAPGAGNVINATNIGISVGGVCANCLFDTTIQGNLIGTDATGTVAFNALFNAIQVAASASTTIGGSTAGAGNVITARADGIKIGESPTSVVIQGNKIGTDISGTKPLGSGNAGIDVGAQSAASTTSGTIGGTSPGEGNIIAFNGTNGVAIGSGNTGWSILGNSIFSNGGLGIDLGADGPTVNDDGDADTGANNLQNYPTMTSVTVASGKVTIAGNLNSIPSTTFRLEFFANTMADSSQFGEGQTFLGSADVTTDATGNKAYNVTFPLNGPISPITATATDPAGNTSEFSPAFATELLNISTRLNVLTGDSVLIGGFIITGGEAKKVIVRALGPSLTMAGITGVLADPVLELHFPDGTVMTNDNWKDTQEAEIIASTIPPNNDLESAIVASLPPGAYTAIVSGKNNGTGVGLVEVYDLDQSAGATLANISTRGFVNTGEDVMIGGFIIGPSDTGPANVLVRAIGPTLVSAGITDPLANPFLELHDGDGNTLMSNDNWKDTQQAEIEATGIPPTSDLESAIVATLSPGEYTAVMSGTGTGDHTGVGLVEVYHLP